MDQFIVVLRGAQPASLEVWPIHPHEIPHEFFARLALLMTPKEYPPDDVLSVTRAQSLCATNIPHLGGNVYLITRTPPGEELSLYSLECLRRGTCEDCAPSPSSDAVYGAAFRVPYFGVLTQFLRRRRCRGFAQTTAHYHGLQNELWCCLAGEGTLITRMRRGPTTDWRIQRLTPGTCVSVPPGVEHQLQTTHYLSTCLVMAGHPQGIPLDDRFNDHYFVAPPPVHVSVP